MLVDFLNVGNSRCLLGLSVFARRGPCGMRPRPGHRLQPGSSQAEIPAAVWVGADAIKVLAGPTLAQLVYQPPPEESLPKNPLLQAADRVIQSTDDEQEKPPKDEPVRAHEFRAADRHSGGWRRVTLPLHFHPQLGPCDTYFAVAAVATRPLLLLVRLHGVPTGAVRLNGLGILARSQVRCCGRAAL
eukprot:s1325_g19.t1